MDEEPLSPSTAKLIVQVLRMVKGICTAVEDWLKEQAPVPK